MRPHRREPVRATSSRRQAATSVVEVVMVMVPLEPARPVILAARVMVPDHDVVMVSVAVDIDMVVRPPLAVAVAALVILGRGRGRREEDGRRHQAC